MIRNKGRKIPPKSMKSPGKSGAPTAVTGLLILLRKPDELSGEIEKYYKYVRSKVKVRPTMLSPLLPPCHCKFPFFFDPLLFL